MKIKRFIEFNEALLPSQFRRFVKAFNRERYNDIFDKYAKIYESDKNHYRLYIPLTAKDKEKETVGKYLADNGYILIDWIGGYCQFEGAKNQSKIGQVLTKLAKTDKKAERMFKIFEESISRKIKLSPEDMLICVSRHPYDIAGADTDRPWTNCMTIGHPYSKRTIALEQQLKKLQQEKSNLDLEWSEHYYGTKEERDAHKDFFKEYDKKSDILNDKIEALEIKIKQRIKSGDNSNYLMGDVKEGSLISYLIRKDDKNIENPLANINIKPFINTEDEEDFILVSDTPEPSETNAEKVSKMYGGFQLQIFKDTLDAWLNEVNGPKKKGWYCMKFGLYRDFMKTKIEKK